MSQADEPYSTRASVGEYRALQQFTDLPPGHVTVPAEEGSEPHLHRDEFAVIDTSDHEPVHGELYCIRAERFDGVRFRIRQMVRDRDVNWCEGGPGIGWYIRLANREVMSLSDGPLRTDHARSKIFGRVVGFYVPERTPLSTDA